MDETNGHRVRSQLDRLKAMPGPQKSLTGQTPARVRTKAAEPAEAPGPAEDPPAARTEPPASAVVPASAREVASDRLVPLSLTAVTSVLDGMGAKYFVDGDDAVGGIWENGYFYFFLLAEDADSPVFQVYGQWELALPGELYPQAAIFANEWNAERTWPKAYARTLDGDQAVGIYGELTVDFGPAVTPGQLDRAINVGIAGALALFDEAGRTFPEAEAIEF